MSGKILRALFLLMLSFSIQVASFANTTEFFAAMSRGEELDDVDLEDVFSLDPFLAPSVRTSRVGGQETPVVDYLRTIVIWFGKYTEAERKFTVRHLSSKGRTPLSDRIWLLNRHLII